MAYLKKFYSIVWDSIKLIDLYNTEVNLSFLRRMKGVSFIIFLIKIPYNIAYYGCLIFFKHIILTCLKYLAILLYYIIRILFYFLYLWSLYILIVYIIKNYFLQLNDILNYKTSIGTIIDLNFVTLLDNKISFLGGFFFDNFLSKFYINESYNLELNKIVFLDLVKNKYLFFSFTLQDFFELNSLFSFGWVLDKKIDELFVLSDIFYYLWLLKYYIIWLIEVFWVFDLIFIQLKYVFWYLFDFIILSLFNLTDFYIFLKIFNFINYFFICISDSFLIELGYSLKINIIIFIEWFFSHLLGYIAKTVKFFEVGAINGVMTSHKKLLFLYDDLNTHKPVDFYRQDIILSLDIFEFYQEQLAGTAAFLALIRGDFIIEGTPYMEIPFELNTQAVEYDGWEGVDNLFEDANITSIYFSKLSFLENYVNINIFNKENFLFEDLDLDLNNVFTILDNFVKPKKDIGFTGYFGFYNFSTIHHDEYEDLDEDDYYYDDEILLSKFRHPDPLYPTPRYPKQNYSDFGYEEYFYLYNISIFYSYFLISINLIIKFSIWFFFIFIKLFIAFILLYIAFYFMYSFYKIDFYNNLKKLYLLFNKSNQLYEYIDVDESYKAWVFHSKITESNFLEFVFNNKIQLYKRIYYVLIEFYYFLKKIMKYLLFFFSSKIIKYFIKIYVFVIKHFNLKNKLLKLFLRLKLNYILLKKFILFLFSIFNFDHLFFFIIFKCLKIIEYIFMFLIILFVWNLIYLFVFILDILYNISIFDFYPTYTILFIILITLFSLSGINNFNKYLLGNLGNYINNNRLFAAMDDFDDVDDWEPNVMTEELDDDLLSDLMEMHYYILNTDTLVGEIGSFRVDLGKSKYHLLLLQRFDMFRLNSAVKSEKHVFSSLKITYENLNEAIFFTVALPRVGKRIPHYKRIYNIAVRTVLLEQFLELTPDILTDLDLFYRNDDDFLFGLKINPIKMRRYLCSIDSIEPEFEIFYDYLWYNNFLIDNLYPFSMYEENFTFLKYKSILNNLLLLPLDNQSYLLNSFNNLSFFKRIGDFNPFNADLGNMDSLDNDFHELLDLEFPMFFQENYVGFQSNYSLLNFKKINKMPILLYNIYECYDNKYKRQFYKNLAYYKKILNLNFFPYVTKYEHQKILFYLNCNEKSWNNIDKKVKKMIIEYPFYDFLIFILISFYFFLIANNIEPFATLWAELDFVTDSEMDILSSYIYNEPLMSSSFIDNFINNITNLIFEKIILIFSSPGYLHENCWRFSKFLYLILYSFIFILPDNIIEQFIYVNTINYIDFIDLILNLWEFTYRFFLGYGLYDLLFIIF